MDNSTINICEYQKYPELLEVQNKYLIKNVTNKIVPFLLVFLGVGIIVSIVVNNFFYQV